MSSTARPVRGRCRWGAGRRGSRHVAGRWSSGPILPAGVHSSARAGLLRRPAAGAPAYAEAMPSLDDLLHAAVQGVGGVERPGQVTMAHAVADAIEAGEHLLVQAGTGTGKSLAYLVPAVQHAVDTGR